MTIQRADTFTRANQSGWGTASDGNAWSASGTEAVSGNEGCIGTSAASTFSLLGAALSSADGEGLVRFQIGGSTDTAGILLRYTDANNHWLIRYDGSGHVNAMVKVSGSYTTPTPTYTFTPTNGTYYWLRARAQGTTIEFKIWQDGTTEPSAWTESYTNSSHNVAGQTGLYGFGHTTNSVKFDHFTFDDLVNPTLNLTTEARASFTARTGLTARQQATFKITSPLKSLVTLAVGKFISRATQVTEAVSKFLVKLPAGSGTGIGDLAVTTQSQSWSGGPAGSPGTETDVTYTDATGSGWRVGMIPSYGAATVSSIYEIDSNVASANQTGLGTTSPDGHVHWLEQRGGTFSGSEDVTFKNAGNFNELIPTGTVFRRGYQAIGDALDANGLQWTVTTYFYPGDPGYLVYRFDMHNPGASAITLTSPDSLEIALIGGLQQVDSTWNAANGGYGTVGGANHVGWPAVLTSIEPDYAYIVPANGSSISIGELTVKKTSLAGLGWSSLQIVYLQASGANGRLKLKVQGTDTTIPAGSTQTVYLASVLRRNLTAADAQAIAADYINPGTPTGPYTGFSYDERTYTFDANNTGNAFTTQLDLSGTGVTARYKPVLKVLNWTATGTPVITWGGSPLTAGSDFRWLHDATNNVLYVQLYFDVVAGAPAAGQRTNATLTVGTKSLTSALRAHFKTRNGLTIKTQGTFKVLAPLMQSHRARFQTAVPLHAHVETSFVTRTALQAHSHTKFLTRFSLAAHTRSQFFSRVSLATINRARFISRFSLDTINRAVFKLATNLKPLAASGRAKFVSRATVKTPAHAAFKTRYALRTTTRGTFWTRISLTGISRARFVLHLPLQTSMRVRSVTATRLKTEGVSKFLVGAKAVFHPFSVAFTAAKQQIYAVFSAKSLLTVGFSRSPAVTQAYSTIQSIATVTDIAGNPVINAASVNVTVTFPDGSTQAYVLGNGVTPNGNGTYTLQYTTKAPGLHTELWIITDSGGDQVEYKQYQSAVL